jgi:hypothetical protein
MRRILPALAAAQIALWPWPAQAAVDHIEILSREPANKGGAYPGVGAYELIRGRGLRAAAARGGDPAILAAQAAAYDRVMAHDPQDPTCAYRVPAAAKP